MHGFIGKDKNGVISYIQTLPYNIACWGAGGGKNGSFNYNPHGYIQFEICEDNLKNPAYYKEAFQAAEDVCVELCRIFGWTANNITSHYEAHKLGYASNHGDPRHWMTLYDDSMDKFRTRVAIKLGKKPEIIDTSNFISEKTIKVKITRAENAEYFKKNIGDVVEVDAEKYVEGVIASEISNAHIEACKAQAVAARTYALSRVGQDFDGVIEDDSATAQAYRAPRGNSSSYPNARAAAIATAGQVLFYNGKLVETCVYSDSNGGRTYTPKEHGWSGERPYLISKPDPWDQALSKGIKNGHGVGMSQTGAKYAASTNAGYRQILSFYYPGTTLVPKYGKGVPENLDPDIPEGEKMVSMTGKYVKVNTAKPAGLNIWNSTNKGLSLLVVPKGETLYVVEDKMTGWVIAKKDGIQGHVDKQYLVEVDDIKKDELELEPPVIEQPSINFEKYEAKIVTTYDAG